MKDIEEWTIIINTLLDEYPGEIEVRETDHEYRVDDREITMWDGNQARISVDSLCYNNDQNKPFIKWALKKMEEYNCY